MHTVTGPTPGTNQFVGPDHKRGVLMADIDRNLG